MSLLARAGLETVALRCPAHPVARALIEAAGRPLAAPSANRSGHVSPTTAAHVLADLDGRIDAVIDAGPCRHGLESTIVACLGEAPALLRPGALPREAIEAALGRPLALPTVDADAPVSPGRLASHYAPRAPLRLAAKTVAADEAALDFAGALARFPARARLDLSPGGDLVEAAANLFAHLRALDAQAPPTIAVAAVPEPASASRSTTASAEPPPPVLLPCRRRGRGTTRKGGGGGRPMTRPRRLHERATTPDAPSLRRPAPYGKSPSLSRASCARTLQ